MLVSVIIPCLNNVADTRACLHSLGQMTGAVPTEILVVDNGSTDDTRALDREFPALRMLRQEHNLGFAGGVNRGIHAARGEWLLVLNNDTLATRSLLTRLLRPLLDDERIGMAAPVSNHVKGEARLPVGSRGATPQGREDLEQELATLCGGVLQDVASLAGLCLLIRRPLMDRLGGFDERYGIGNFEDDDLCLRARLTGTRLVIARDAFLHHHGHRTFQAMQVDYPMVLREREALHVEKWLQDPAGRAMLRAGLGWIDEASVRTALRRYPDWPDGHWLTARAAAMAGSVSKARVHLETFLSRCPHHSEAWLIWARERLREGDDRAMDQVWTFLTSRLWFTAGQSAQLLSARARRFIDRGQPDGARQDLRAAMAQEPEDPEFWNEAGALWFELGDHDTTEICFHEALRQGSPRALSNLATLHFRSGQLARALTLWQEALAAQPGDPALRQNVKTALATLQQ